MAVSHGKADAAVYDKPVLLNLASKTGGMSVMDELLEPDRYGFAVRKESNDLKQAIDLLLKEMKANGEYEAMMNRWMPLKGEPGPMPDFPVNAPSGDLILEQQQYPNPCHMLIKIRIYQDLISSWHTDLHKNSIKT
jgi:polar amino acid transport system substrate-binding protein